MPVTTTSAAIHITPVVVKTLLKHTKKKAERVKNSKPDEVPRDDIFFDEAFNIVKAFIALGTKNTVESLQAFTNTHVPAPYWAAVSPVTIPLSTCNSAADLLIEWFGPEELKYVVGGERWWQVRGLNGIDAEWIAELEDIDSEMELKPEKDKKVNPVEDNIRRMEKLESVMLYVHGGGYFWGSINTHRYQILHYAHKFNGRAFAVNYRKAPQYPWPCPLHDVIAAYLYLIRPPAGAIHKAVPSSKIVFAGDSAGGGLCLTTLTILRDLGLPMPAGAVLISPWVDLTHSFPSVMENYDTDIIPRHGFLAKPSTLWPAPTLPGSGRIVPTTSCPPPKPGDTDTLKPSPKRVDEAVMANVNIYGPGDPVKSQKEMLDEYANEAPSGIDASGRDTSSSDVIAKILDDHDLDHWEPKPPKVFMEDPNAEPLELRSQIQLYATNEQVTHPLVSPILQGSLGNLPPLYIIAGDGELLRDEIIYLAHKAAHPSQYPTRKGVLREAARQQENASKFTTPTKVHLQVFDGMCHVLTIFMFTQSARYAYRSIAEFIKHVTQNDEVHILKNPFPELHDPKHLSSNLVPEHKPRKLKKKPKPTSKQYNRLHQTHDLESTSSPATPFETNLYLKNEQTAILEVNHKLADVLSDNPGSRKHNSEDLNAGHAEEDIPRTLMIRERVDIRGAVRPMEPADTLQALKVDVSYIGLIKEAPAQRWKTGQDLWDKKYASNGEKAIKQQVESRARAERLLQNAIDQGFVHQSHGSAVKDGMKNYQHKIQVDRRWGPLDLQDETPPTTAIAGRRDTPEAVALLKNSIYHAPPVTHLTVPKLKNIDAIRAAFDPKDSPNKRPQQSAAEEQVSANVLPIHGLRIWDDLVRYFGRKSTSKAADGLNAAVEKIGLKSDSDE